MTYGRPDDKAFEFIVRLEIRFKSRDDSERMTGEGNSGTSL